MDPLDFYELAKEIRQYSSSSTEALKRTIVGRVYYAIFLMIREELRLSLRNSVVRSLYERLSEKGLIHSLIVDILKEVDPTNHFGGLLYGMHKRRRAADYRLAESRNWDQEIEDNISDAEEILRNKATVQAMLSQKSMEIENCIGSWYRKDELRMRESS